MSFLPLMAVRKRDSSTGSSDWASSRVKVRSDMEDSSILARGARVVSRRSLVVGRQFHRIANDERPTTDEAFATS
jgi:hypothetical protein